MLGEGLDFAKHCTSPPNPFFFSHRSRQLETCRQQSTEQSTDLVADQAADQAEAAAVEFTGNPAAPTVGLKQHLLSLHSHLHNTNPPRLINRRHQATATHPHASSLRSPLPVALPHPLPVALPRACPSTQQQKVPCRNHPPTYIPTYLHIVPPPPSALPDGSSSRPL